MQTDSQDERTRGEHTGIHQWYQQTNREISFWLDIDNKQTIKPIG